MVGLGAVVGRLVLTDGYLNYVKPGMRLWLISATLLLVIVGLSTFVRGLRQREHHDHGHPMTRAAWLVIVPAFALVLMPTDPLGAFAANRKETRQQPGFITFRPLPQPNDGAVTLSLSEFVDRAFLDKERQLEGLRVRLTGFVTPSEDPSASFTVTRFAMTCCAADAFPIQVDVFGQPSPEVDSWVVLTGKWKPHEGGEVEPYSEIVQFEADDLIRIDRPSNPYEAA